MPYVVYKIESKDKEIKKIYTPTPHAHTIGKYVHVPAFTDQVELYVELKNIDVVAEYTFDNTLKDSEYDNIIITYEKS